MPETIPVDGSEAHAVAIRRDKEAHGTAIIIRQVKSLNHVVEQDHRGVKREARAKLRFTPFEAARSTPVGIARMLRLKTGQLAGEDEAEGLTPVKQSYDLAA